MIKYHLIATARKNKQTKCFIAQLSPKKEQCVGFWLDYNPVARIVMLKDGNFIKINPNNFKKDKIDTTPHTAIYEYEGYLIIGRFCGYDIVKSKITYQNDVSKPYLIENDSVIDCYSSIDECKAMIKLLIMQDNLKNQPWKKK